jgi:hypothetical protein
MSRDDADKAAARVRAVVGEADVLGELRLSKKNSVIEYFVYVPSRTGFWGELKTKAEVESYLAKVQEERRRR